MSRIVYSTSLRRHMNHLGHKPFYRRPLLWVALFLINAFLAVSFFYKIPLDTLWTVLPQAKATQRPSSVVAVNPPNGNDIVAKVAVEPEDPRQGKAAIFIAKEFHIAREAAEQVVRITFKVSKKYKIDPLLMLAMMGVETRFNPWAESSVGALGLTQVLPEFHPEKVAQMEKSNGHILNLADNVEFGLRSFSEYHKKFNGNDTMALQQYNGSLYDPNTAYSRKVFGLRSKISQFVVGQG